MSAMQEEQQAVSLQEAAQQAQAAARAGDHAQVARVLALAVGAALAAGTAVPRGFFVELATACYHQRDFTAAEHWLREGLRFHPRDFGLNNVLGVVLKNAGRFEEALSVLALAEKASPKSIAVKVNQGNVLIALRRGAEAVRLYKDLVKREPQVSEHARLLGVAWRLQGDYEQALKQFQGALRLDPKNFRACIDALRVLRDLGRIDEALALVESSLQQFGASEELIGARATLLRRAGRLDEALQALQEQLEREPGAAWAHFQLGRLVAAFDRDKANTHLREAIRLAPEELDYQLELAESLDRTRGPDEAKNIQEAYEIVRRCSDAGGNLLPWSRTLCNVLERAGDYERAARIGDFDTLGRFWAETQQVSALHHHLARVETPGDRRKLLEFHRTWGRSVEAVAARSPLKPVPARARREKLRIGLMSSDLRHHPVSYFVLPLIENYDRSRFEVFCYSWSTKPEDNVQKYIAERVDAFRLDPKLSPRDAAQLIRNDGCDILMELGGSTDMNKLEVMAWRPARVQGSWLGYPHSAGLETIDYILVDPFIKPKDPALLIERPMELERSWVVLGRAGFHDRHEIDPRTPQERNGGVLTFGTMNNPYKYRPAVLAAWARVVREVEGSRFLFVRPEGAVPAFCENICRAFEAEGVARDRVEFIPVRGTHMQHYNAIDICLDAFPQTGGTTTCESLWMGVPVVSLVGETFFERLSYSNLSNAGLGDLCDFDLDAFTERAKMLAQDHARRRYLRIALRSMIRRSPLGQAELFTRDFEQAVVRAVQAGGKA